MKRILLFLWVITVLFVFRQFRVQATSMGGLSILPADPDSETVYSHSWFVYNLVPGEERKDSLLLKNDSNERLKVKIYPVDGVTTADGTFALKMREEDNTDLGSWVFLPQKEVVLQPKENKKVAFVIRVPEDASVGDHLGGIVLEREPVSTEGNINIVTRVGVRIYETVPGELKEEASLGHFSYKLSGKGLRRNIYFTFPIGNSGNLRLEPQGKIEIFWPLIGKKVASLTTDNLGMVLPGSKVVLQSHWSRPPIAGVFLAKVKLKYGRLSDNLWQQRQLIVYATPLFWLLLVFLTVAVFLLIRKFRGK
jgi:hypothetical protein